ncbi:hypothetical protein M427DRAFT_58868 [Gonapodya prolifera JEL478]|uniref:Uncharacterized protein n=1 Tax=Gonapodya prolifera (strain JEL478) TaxID=1344416 RepID=A0A139A8U1_GONPJ|nr:hypothetical protein M427DRAFT_58868 [Gonapodya prolifera JEL478]|eukprot:KXS13147.1 hypothetical protein M427DRAFT_58868 [Gonapodya prolifera JEL478]
MANIPVPVMVVIVPVSVYVIAVASGGLRWDRSVRVHVRCLQGGSVYKGDINTPAVFELGDWVNGSAPLGSFCDH